MLATSSHRKTSISIWVRPGLHKMYSPLSALCKYLLWPTSYSIRPIYVALATLGQLPKQFEQKDCCVPKRSGSSLHLILLVKALPVLLLPYARPSFIHSNCKLPATGQVQCVSQSKSSTQAVVVKTSSCQSPLLQSKDS